MVTIIHTADVHLGVKYLMLGDKAERQREALRETFAKIIELCRTESAQVLVIAGDLFDSNRVSENLITFAKSKFRELAKSGIEVAISPGTHDCLSSGAIFLRDDFIEGLPHVHVFRDPAQVKKEYPDLGLTVWAEGNSSNTSTKSPLAFLKSVDLSTPLNIAIAHGSLAIEGKYAKDDYPIAFDDISSSRMNYIALGHWHGAQDVSQANVKAWYAGSPEFTYLEGKGGLGSGYVLKVTIEGNETKVEPVRVSSREFDQREIDMSQMGSGEELSQKILEGANPNLIRFATLTGFVSPAILPDPGFLESELGASFFKLTVRNASHVRLEDIDEHQYPPEFILGQFVRRMKREIATAKTEKEKKLLEEVLQLGVAELEGKHVIES